MTITSTLGRKTITIVLEADSSLNRGWSSQEETVMFDDGSIHTRQLPPENVDENTLASLLPHADLAARVLAVEAELKDKSEQLVLLQAQAEAHIREKIIYEKALFDAHVANSGLKDAVVQTSAKLGTLETLTQTLLKPTKEVSSG